MDDMMENMNLMEEEKNDDEENLLKPLKKEDFYG